MNTKGVILRIIVLILLVLFLGALYGYRTDMPKSSMSLTLYIQDKEAAMTTDCGITKKMVVEVPEGDRVEESVKYLFDEELAAYGRLESVVVENGVAKINLESDMLPSGSPILSLSSCEISHLMSVLIDTLSPLEGIETIELYTPNGKVEF